MDSVGGGVGRELTGSSDDGNQPTSGARTRQVANLGDGACSLTGEPPPASVVCRRGERERRPASRILAQEAELKPLTTGKRKSKKRKAVAPTPRPHDKLPDGTPFSCDMCASPYVCNVVSRRGANKYKSQPSRHKPAHHQKVDQKTGKTLILCNACGLAFDRPKKVSRAKVFSPEDKMSYLGEANTFAESLVQGLNDPDARRLSCPNFKSSGVGCGCMQAHIIGCGEMSESRQRASDLLTLLKEAKQLRAEKSYSPEGQQGTVPGKSRKKLYVGLGNGQLKSKNYEQFVMKNRTVMRNEMKFCEKAVQRVLLYSNNFLHKKLKTADWSFRAERTKGKAALGKFLPIEDIPRQTCCIDGCVMIAVTHGRLLESWRKRASSGQQEARRVLSEMLTPSGGARTNCYKFITMVTGCSGSTISRVNDRMKRSGGLRDPTEHGLKHFWREKKLEITKQAEHTQEGDQQMLPDSAAPTLQKDRDQLLMLQRQLTQQQIHIQHQQQMLQRQLISHSILTQQPSMSSGNVIQEQPTPPGIMSAPHNLAIMQSVPSSVAETNNDLAIDDSSNMSRPTVITINQLQQMLDATPSSGVTPFPSLQPVVECDDVPLNQLVPSLPTEPGTQTSLHAPYQFYHNGNNIVFVHPHQFNSLVGQNVANQELVGHSSVDQGLIDQISSNQEVVCQRLANQDPHSDLQQQQPPSHVVPSSEGSAETVVPSSEGSAGTILGQVDIANNVRLSSENVMQFLDFRGSP